MKQAKYILDKDYVIGEVDRRLFGTFVEHLGRVVYDGIYEPGHPLADGQGFRKDVIAAARDANISIARYPGGNFVSGYRWTDGIGPAAQRKRRLNLAWNMIESNAVGIDEFAGWAKKADVELMATVNLGTGTPQEAGEMVEYCNHPEGTYWSDLRRENGCAQPHQIKLWCLGNEMDGEWQICRLTAEEYARKALETAKIMKLTDPTLELVVCGSCCPDMATYPDWDRIVLEHTYEKVEYISLHRYYAYQTEGKPGSGGDDSSDIAHFAVDLRDYLHTIISTADIVRAKKHSARTVQISFDEWNVIKKDETFTRRDALVYGSLLNTFMSNSDRVKVACQALLVNAGGLFSTEKGGGLVKHPVFYPFQLTAKYAKGVSLLDRLTCPNIQTNHYGELPALQTASVYNEQDGMLSVFVVNFDGKDDMTLSMDLRSFGAVEMIEHVVLCGDPDECNSLAEPERVKPVQAAVRPADRGRVDVVIPKLSWNLLRFSAGEASAQLGNGRSAG